MRVASHTGDAMDDSTQKGKDQQEPMAPAPKRRKRVSSARGAVVVAATAVVAGGAGWVLTTLGAVHGGTTGF